MPVELGFEYRNGLTLKELSEIEGSHVLNSCDDPDNWVIADHPSLPGYSGKYGDPGSFTSVGSYCFNVRTIIDRDWYDSAVCETPDALAVPSYGEPQDIPQVFDWKYRDCGDWIELRERCIPDDAKGHVTIPERIDGKPVVSIGEGAFYGCSGLT